MIAAELSPESVVGHLIRGCGGYDDEVEMDRSNGGKLLLCNSFCWFDGCDLEFETREYRKWQFLLKYSQKVAVSMKMNTDSVFIYAIQKFPEIMCIRQQLCTQMNTSTTLMV